MRKSTLLKGLLVIAVIVALGWVVKAQFDHIKEFTPDSIRDFLETFGKKAAIVYIIAYTLNMLFPFPPLTILSLAAGLAFGKLWGGIYLMIGALLGSTIAFFLSRSLARGVIEKGLKGRVKDFDEAMKARGFVTLLFLRIFPIIPHEVLNYASGLTKISFRDYFLATLIGIIPGVVIVAYFGGELGEIDSIRELISFKFIATAVVVILLLFVPVIYRFMNRNKQEER